MKKNLTEQQWTFCQAYAEGQTASEAYKKAYSVKGKQGSLILYHANKLLNDEVIQKEIQEIKEKKQASLNYTAEESANKIKEIQKKALEKGDMTNALKAEEMLQKITGINKDNATVNFGVVGDFKEFYAAICAKKDYGSTKTEKTESKTLDLSNCPKSQIIESK